MRKRCKKCLKEFCSTPLQLFCTKCISEMPEATMAAQARADRKHERRWLDLCPPAYQDTVIEKLPNPVKAAEVMDCDLRPPGIILHGPTGTGKTRCGWLLVRREFDRGKSIRVLNSKAAFDYNDAYLKGKISNWVDSQCQPDLLFLDDVFKAKITDSFEQAMFAIVEYRVSHYRPILVTSNDTGETLAARMSPDRGDAFVERLRSFREIRFLHVRV